MKLCRGFLPAKKSIRLAAQKIFMQGAELQKSKKVMTLRVASLSRFYAMVDKYHATYAEVLSGGLVARNIRIRGRRTSVRLHNFTWQALEEAARAEGMTIDDFCTGIDSMRLPQVGFATTLRTFLLAYFRLRAPLPEPVVTTH